MLEKYFEFLTSHQPFGSPSENQPFWLYRQVSLEETGIIAQLDKAGREQSFVSALSDEACIIECLYQLRGCCDFYLLSEIPNIAQTEHRNSYIFLIDAQMLYYIDQYGNHTPIVLQDNLKFQGILASLKGSDEQVRIRLTKDEASNIIRSCGGQLHPKSDNHLSLTTLDTALKNQLLSCLEKNAPIANYARSLWITLSLRDQSVVIRKKALAFLDNNFTILNEKCFIDFSYTNLSDLRFELDFSGQQLQGVYFAENRKLHTLKFKYACLNKANFTQCNISEAFFVGAWLNDAIFDRADCKYANFEHAIFSSVQTLLAASSLQGVTLSEHSFEGLDITPLRGKATIGQGSVRLLLIPVSDFRTEMRQTALNYCQTELSGDNNSLKSLNWPKNIEDWTSIAKWCGKPQVTLCELTPSGPLFKLIEAHVYRTSDYISTADTWLLNNQLQASFEAPKNLSYPKNIFFALMNTPSYTGFVGSVTVIKIKILHHPKLWQKYRIQRQRILEELKDNPQSGANYAPFLPWSHCPELSTLPLINPKIGECLLFHGVKNHIVMPWITRKGFKTDHMKPTLRGWGELGKGIYLSEEFSKAALYIRCRECKVSPCNCSTSESKPKSKRKIFLSRAILGRILEDRNREHRWDDAGSGGCHSSWGPTSQAVMDSDFLYNEFAISKMEQIYPEFIITYRENPREFMLNEEVKLLSSVAWSQLLRRNNVAEASLLTTIAELLKDYHRLLAYRPHDFWSLQRQLSLIQGIIVKVKQTPSIPWYEEDCLQQLEESLTKELKEQGFSLLEEPQVSLAQKINHYQRGYYYLKRKEFSAAISHWTKLTELLPQWIPAWLSLAESYRNISERQMIQAIHQAWRINPETVRNACLYKNSIVDPHPLYEAMVRVLEAYDQSKTITAVEVNWIEDILAQIITDISANATSLSLEKSEKLTRLFILTYRVIPSHLPELRQQFFKLILQQNWQTQEATRKTIISKLRYEPNADGWYPALEEEEKAWWLSLQKLLEEVPDVDLKQYPFIVKLVDVKNPQSKTIKCYAFKHEIAEQINVLFDHKGQLLDRKLTTDGQRGRHIVKKITYQGQFYWLKCYPEQAGIEFAITRLDRYLGGQATPLSELLKLYTPGNLQGFAVQLSQHLVGDPLLVIQDNNGKKEEVIAHPDHLMALTIDSFTQHLFRVLLTNPEDDTGNDYSLCKGKAGFELKRVDNERAFYTPNVTERRIFKTNSILQVKSMLYCLPQMQQPLSEELLKRFNRIEPLKLLTRWVEELALENEYHALLFPEQSEIKAHFNCTKPDMCLLGIGLADNLIKELFDRLHGMQHVIQMTNYYICGLDLLVVIQPEFKNHYAEVFQQNKFPDLLTDTPTVRALNTVRRFQVITKGLYQYNSGFSQLKAHGAQAITVTLKLKMTITAEIVRKILDTTQNSPAQQFQVLEKLRTIKLIEYKNKLLMEPFSNESLSEFQSLTVRHRLQLFEDLQKELSNLKTLAKQERILDAIKGMPFHELSLETFASVLTNPLLTSILINAKMYLLKLNLNGAKQLTNDLSILTECVHLLDLTMSNLPRVTQLKGIFVRLSKLVLDDCTSLQTVDIQAPSLKIMSANGCRQLQVLQTGSLLLSELSLNECRSLIESTLKEIVPFQGHLQRLQLINTNITHRIFREAYPFLACLQLKEYIQDWVEKLDKHLQETFAKMGIAASCLDVNTKQRLYDRLGQRLSAVTSMLKEISELLGEWWSSSNTKMAALAWGQICLSCPLSPELLRPISEKAKLILTPLARGDEAYDELQALVNLKINEDVNWLIKALQNENKDIRREAAWALGQFAERDNIGAVAVLINALADKDSNVRREVARALNKLNVRIQPEVIIALLSVVQNGTDNEREDAVWIVSKLKINNPKVVAALTTAMQDKNRRICQEAAQALNKLGAEISEMETLLLQGLLDEKKRDKDKSDNGNVYRMLHEGHAFLSRRVSHLAWLLQDSTDIRADTAKIINQFTESGADIAARVVKTIQGKKWSAPEDADNALEELTVASTERVKELVKILKSKDGSKAIPALKLLCSWESFAWDINEALKEAVDLFSGASQQAPSSTAPQAVMFRTSSTSVPALEAKVPIYTHSARP